ncbi:MAG TPA: glycoside hydrolase family 88 protein [Pelobium sp.]
MNVKPIWKPFYLTFLIYAFFMAANPASAQVDFKKEIKFIVKKERLMLKSLKKVAASKKVSPRTFENSKLVMVVPHDWTSGFFPGILWYLYGATKKKKFFNEAVRYTNKLSEEQYDTKTHDLGFIINNSFGNGFTLTQNPAYKSIIINAAKSLCSRFNPNIGLIKSWDHNKNIWTYPVIIDNMMNLELLFNATKISGDSSYYRIAVSHANKTLKNHFRDNGSSYHVVDYNISDGKVNKKMTAQGYSDESSWARGEAWALYGFTSCFEATKDSAYLQRAITTATYILNHPRLPQDLVPYWDFDDPTIPKTFKDASAAAITSSALFRLAKLTGNVNYKVSADKIIFNLANHYKVDKNDTSGFILRHSVGHKAINSEVDVPIIYADYYYVEALLRSNRFLAD